jgi:prolyl oligopeptidase
LSWLPSGRGFFYRRLREISGSAAPGEQYRRATVFLHQLETTPAKDKPVFGWEIPGNMLHEDDLPSVQSTRSGEYLLALATQAVANECAIYVAPMPASFDAAPKWRLLVSAAAGVTAFGVRGDDLYLLSHHEAPRYKALRVKLNATDLSKAITVIPETRNVLRDLVVAKDAAYVSQSNGSGSDLIRVTSDGRSEKVPLPFPGAIRELTGNADSPGALFTLESWTRPKHWFRVASSEPLSVQDTRLLPSTEFDASLYEVRARWATSKDGTQVPLSIICRKDTKLDGSHLVQLLAYGAFGNSADPVFRPYRLVWLERGGIIAVVHARGGGDLGEAWHRAGMRTEKQHTIDDVLAGASYLIQERYTTASRLAAWAESAGGIAVGGAMVQRPDLFGAIVLNAPVLDAVRNVVAHPENIPEYGSLENADEFRTLLQVSPYHHISDGVRYPATLICIGTNDARVAIWQSTKFVARLQAASTSGQPVLLRVSRRSGHGGATIDEANARVADQYAFMFAMLGSRAP